jgi:hypothetical protein
VVRRSKIGHPAGRWPRVLFICKTILAPPSFGAATVNPFLGPGLGRKTLNAENHTTWKVGVDLPIGPDLAGFKNDSLCGCCGHGAEYNLGSRRGIVGCCFNLIAKPARMGTALANSGGRRRRSWAQPRRTMHGPNAGTGMERAPRRRRRDDLPPRLPTI